MRDSRHHADVLIAGLLLLGFVTWLGGIANALTDPDHFVKGLLWFGAAFCAAQVARAVLDDLEVHEVAIASALTVTLAIGLHDMHRGKPLTAALLIPIAIATAGGVLGGWSGHKRASRVFLVLAAGAASFGVAVLTIGLAVMYANDNRTLGFAVLLGAPIGSVVAGIFIPGVGGRHTGLGLALIVGTISGTFSTNFFASLVAAGILAFIFGAIGGLVGGKIREAREGRKPREELPEMRQVR